MPKRGIAKAYYHATPSYCFSKNPEERVCVCLILVKGSFGKLGIRSSFFTFWYSSYAYDTHLKLPHSSLMFCSVFSPQLFLFAFQFGNFPLNCLLKINLLFPKDNLITAEPPIAILPLAINAPCFIADNVSIAFNVILFISPFGKTCS